VDPDHSRGLGHVSPVRASPSPCYGFPHDTQQRSGERCPARRALPSGHGEWPRPTGQCRAQDLPFCAQLARVVDASGRSDVQIRCLAGAGALELAPEPGGPSIEDPGPRLRPRVQLLPHPGASGAAARSVAPRSRVESCYCKYYILCYEVRAPPSPLSTTGGRARRQRWIGPRVPLRPELPGLFTRV
jgi:hypothetical protein